MRYIRTVQRLKQLTDDELRALVEQHKGNFAAVARELGTCTVTTHVYLHRLGLKALGRSTSPRLLPVRSREELLALYEKCGYNATTMGRQLSVSRERARQLLKKAGILHGRELQAAGILRRVKHEVPESLVQEIIRLRNKLFTVKQIAKTLGVRLTTIIRVVRVRRNFDPMLTYSQLIACRRRVRLRVAEKACSRCKETKPISLFHRIYRKGETVAYRPECKPCIATYVWLRRGCKTPQRKHGTANAQ